jgi:iron complex transport system substrate-binding protein
VAAGLRPDRKLRGQQAQPRRFEAEVRSVAVTLVMRWLLLLALLLPTACDTEPAANVGPRRIASLSPAVTSLLRAGGMGGQIVAVSNFEPGKTELPRVGDYLTIDWEQLAASGADVMIVQGEPNRLPEGLIERAAALGVAVETVQIDVLNDVPAVMEQLRVHADDEASVFDAIGQWRARMLAVEQATLDRPKVRTLIAASLSGGQVLIAGRGTYLDELLALAGGENATDAEGWVTLDAEALSATEPALVVHLLPTPSDQTRAEAAEAWPRMLPGLPVETLDEADVLLPGYNTARLAEQLAAVLERHRP